MLSKFRFNARSVATFTPEERAYFMRDEVVFQPKPTLPKHVHLSQAYAVKFAAAYLEVQRRHSHLFGAFIQDLR